MKGLLKEKVTHIKYGMGTITEESENRITVQFDGIEEEKVFAVPVSFEKFLVLQDEKLQKKYHDAAIKERLEHKKQIENRVVEIKRMEAELKMELAANKKKRGASYN